MGDDREHALQLLRRALNNQEADFRPGQWECIITLLQRGRILVVQRTGWGKSMIYFLATRLLRDQGSGPTLLISPLLSLMRNQILSANRIGIRAATINSSNTEEWNEVNEHIGRNEVDVLLISPERLENDGFRQNVLGPIADQIGLFVVDEAHCISDWGHDFRPDYRRIVRVLQALPGNIPVLATTATANNRVVDDVASQLGQLKITRGPLVRTSLRLQNIWMPSPAARLAWLAETLPQIPGSGIIYTLTKRDAERVTAWLQLNGIDIRAYHSESPDRETLENMLLNNQLKALVATVALGMGFDKPDLEFVIHYQRPGSLVHYYQQVGRAGRAVDDAYGILLSGEEDLEITNYFIQSAFPPQIHVNEVLNTLADADDGLSVPMIQQRLNMTKGSIEKVLKLLSVEAQSPVLKQGPRWYRTAVEYNLNQEAIEQICRLRTNEQNEMLEYMQTDNCLMEFISNSLDDPHAGICGRCSNCMGEPLLPETASNEMINRASVFIRRSYQPIEPRRQWPNGYQFQQNVWRGRIQPELQCEEGRALSLWGDIGWGEMVRQGKNQDNRFNDDLIEGCFEMIQDWKPDPFPEWLTCVPSLNHPELVPDFALRLSERMELPFVRCIIKTRNNAQQKTMQNSFQQAQNLDNVFDIQGDVSAGPVFLLDDMVDSRWTITVLGALLRTNGSGKVFPLALALNSLG